jgi:hypothetical protein
MLPMLFRENLIEGTQNRLADTRGQAPVAPTRKGRLGVTGRKLSRGTVRDTSKTASKKLIRKSFLKYMLSVYMSTHMVRDASIEICSDCMTISVCPAGSRVARHERRIGLSRQCIALLCDL